MRNHGLEIIDFHAHFLSSRTEWTTSWRQRLVERYGEENTRILVEQSMRDRERMRRQWGFEDPKFEEISDEKQAEKWILDLKAKHIARINFVTGGGNDNLSELVRAHTNMFSGFAHHSLQSEDAASELERAVNDLGLKGYKIVASSQSRPIDDRSFYGVWETAERLEIPILIHFGVLGGGGASALDLRNMNPLTLWEVAKMFPKITFVIPHFGAGYIRELLQLCWSCPNVSIDTSGSNRWMRWMPYEINLEKLFRKAMETVGPDRLIFGSDSSYFPRGFSLPYLSEQLRACRSIGLEHDSIERIFHGNAARLLKLE